MKKIFLFFIVFTSFYLVSCNKNDEAVLAEQTPKEETILAELQNANKILLESSTQTKSGRSISGWEIAKADGVGALKAVFGSPWNVIKTISNIAMGNYGSLLLRVGAKAAWASIKAYADSENEDFTTTYTMDKYVLCVEYIANVVDSEDAVNIGNYGYGLMNEPSEEGTPEDPIDVPIAYKWTNELSREHNIGLEYLLGASNTIVFDDNNYISNLESKYGIDSLYKAALIADMDGITYNMDYADYFDNNDVVGQILVLFANLYEQYVVTYQDVVTIVEQYVSIIDKSEDLTDLEKAALISALNVISQSNLYWNNVLSATKIY